VHPTVVGIGRIAGGTDRNILPDSVVLGGTVRTLNPAAHRSDYDCNEAAIPTGIKVLARAALDLLAWSSRRLILCSRRLPSDGWPPKD